MLAYTLVVAPFFLPGSSRESLAWWTELYATMVVVSVVVASLELGFKNRLPRSAQLFRHIFAAAFFILLVKDLVYVMLPESVLLLGCGGSGNDAVPTGPEVVETVPVVVATVAPGPGEPSVLRFDGSDDRVTVPYSPTFPTEVFSFGAWIKLAPPRGRAAIFARGEDDNSFNLSWQLYVLSDGTLEVMLEDSRENNYCYPANNCTPLGSCSGGDLFVADDIWHHVAVTREGSGALAVYVDGVRSASCEGTGVPSSNNFQVLSIGCTFGTIGPPPGGREPPVWFFPGLIDEPAMWSLALTDAEIASVFSSGVDASSAGLVGLWKFDEGGGQLVTDLSPAGNDGFLGESPSPDSADPLWEAEDAR